jgi:hypothetical protein
VFIKSCIIKRGLQEEYQVLSIYKERAVLRSRSLEGVLAMVMEFMLKSNVKGVHFGVLELSSGDLSLKQNIELSRECASGYCKK